MGERGAPADREVTNPKTGAFAVPPSGPRPPNRVLLEWRGGERFDAHRPGGPSIHIDGSGETGPGPMDTLLGALVACSAIDVTQILAKRRTPVESMEIEVIGTRVETTPRRLRHVLLKFRIAGAGIESIHAERAVELAITKYCSVKDSLDPELPVEWEVELGE
ncbi:MAG TPA: OsmC family protein [Gemmatimonadaceae bacterium]|nr:OsmC family protein [Gemmatimonadaceae bacterium]